MSDLTKITPAHRQRLAYVYVRQSSAAQVRVNTESLERQYELTGRATELGWDLNRPQHPGTEVGSVHRVAAGAMDERARRRRLAHPQAA